MAFVHENNAFVQVDFDDGRLYNTIVRLYATIVHSSESKTVTNSFTTRKSPDTNGFSTYFYRMARLFLLFTFYCLLSTGCKQTELYERLESIPGGEWKSSYQPSFTFNISDTLSAYNVYVTVRHTNTYAYNNLWLQSSLQLPADTLLTQRLDLKLASPEGWLGTGMDDVYESRIKITPQAQRFPAAGPVTFALKQIMRQDPLPGVLQVGVRVEKAVRSE